MKKLLSTKKFQAGFTLIELLIVIVIIVIVIGVGAASYTTVARNGRDAQRKSDIEKMQLALEEFFADNGAYPDEGWISGASPTNYDRVTCMIDGSGRATAGIAVGEAFTCGGRTYLSSMPADPSTGLGYYYESDDTFCVPPASPLNPWANCRKYTIWAELENPNDPDRWVDGQDIICDAAKKSSNPLDSDGWYDGLYEDNYNGNYCVHN